MLNPTNYLGYVEEAVRSLKEVAGSSRPAITKYIKVRRRAKALVPAAHQHAQAMLCTVTRSPPPPFQHSLGARAAYQCLPSCPPFCNPYQFCNPDQRGGEIYISSSTFEMKEKQDVTAAFAALSLRAPPRRPLPRRPAA